LIHEPGWVIECASWLEVSWALAVMRGADAST
jgi:hypothetical protein